MTSIQQGAALQRQVWAIANDVSGAVDSSPLNAEFKITVSKIDQFRKDIDAIVAEIEGENSEGDAA